MTWPLRSTRSILPVEGLRSIIRVGAECGCKEFDLKPQAAYEMCQVHRPDAAWPKKSACAQQNETRDEDAQVPGRNRATAQGKSAEGKESPFGDADLPQQCQIVRVNAKCPEQHQNAG